MSNLLQPSPTYYAMHVFLDACQAPVLPTSKNDQKRVLTI